MRKIVFLDRDGVVNRNPVYLDYVKNPSEFRFLPGSKRAIMLLNKAGFKVIIISNQTGVGKGLYSKDDLKGVTDKMLKGLKASNARLDKICYCIHHPDSGCGCRKPKTGMFKKAVGETSFDRNNSYFVGDTERDTLAGHSFKVKTIAVLSGYAGRKDIKKWRVQPDFIAKDLLEAVEKVVLGAGMSLRALNKRSNHKSKNLISSYDCFVAGAPRNDRSFRLPRRWRSSQ